MKHFIFASVLLSLTSFAVSACPNIDGVYLAKENGAMIAFETIDNTLRSPNYETFGSGIKLDGKSHAHPKGGEALATCSRNEIVYTVKVDDKIVYSHSIKKLSNSKLKTTETFFGKEENEVWKFQLKKI